MRTLLIVDDYAPFRRLARRTLEGEHFTVVSEANDAASALVAARVLRPQVVLLDVDLPDADGFAVADKLMREGHAPVVVLASSVEPGARLADTPARGFISKSKLSAAALAED